MKTFFHATALTFIAAALIGCAAVMTHPSAISVPSSLSMEQVGQAVRKALVGRGWMITSNTGHSYTAQLSGNGWQVTIKTPYNSQQVNIEYVKSYGLDYDTSGPQTTINRHWNSWMAYLTQDISQNLARMASQS